MKTKKIYLFFSIILLSVLNTGCIGVNRNFKIIRNSVLENLNTNFEKTIEFSVGKSAFLFAGKFMDIDDDESENIKEMLNDVSHVSIGVYEKENNEENYNNSKLLLKRITNNLAVEDWESIVKVNGDDETLGIYIKENDTDEINEMFAVILSGNELVMLNFNGNLNSLAEKVIEQQGFGTKIADKF